MGSTTFKWALNLVHMGLRSSALVMCAIRTQSFAPLYLKILDPPLG